MSSDTEPTRPDSAQEPAGGIMRLSGALARVVTQITVPVSVVVGSVEVPLASLVDLSEGSVVALDRDMDEPVDILVAGQVVARGELVSIEGRLGVRITQILHAQEGTGGD